MSQSQSECRQTTMPSAFESKSKLSLDQGSQLLGSQLLGSQQNVTKDQSISSGTEAKRTPDARDSTLKHNMFHIKMAPHPHDTLHEVNRERSYQYSD